MQKLKKLKFQLINELKPQKFKKILDLGCGEGKLSLSIANTDSLITGIDKTPKIIQDKRFKHVNKDLLNFKFNEKYDLIIVSLVLHYLEKLSAKRLLIDCFKNLNKEGILFLICLSKKDYLYNQNKSNGFFSINETQNLIKSKPRIIKEFKTSMEKHKDNKLYHKHSGIFAIFQK